MIMAVDGALSLSLSLSLFGLFEIQSLRDLRQAPRDPVLDSKNYYVLQFHIHSQF